MGAARSHLYTIGHSTRSLDELFALLRASDVRCLADVRTVPRSRHVPQFNRNLLAIAAPTAGIDYRHLPGLGGLRKRRQEGSPNRAWRSEGFRAFADYMQTAEFARALDKLWGLARRHPTAIMCAEALHWRCHRSLIADAFMVRGGTVLHILSDRKVEPHRLTSFARVCQGRITYPPSAAQMLLKSD